MAWTTVKVSVSRSLIAQSWPPLSNHATVTLDPRQYRLAAETVYGIADPSACVVDVREQREAVVRVSAHDEAIETAALPKVHSVQRLETIGGTRGRRADRDESLGTEGRLRVAASDTAIGIDVVGLEPPYRRLSKLGDVSATLPAGAYRVDFRFGPERLSSTDVYLSAGDELIVKAPTSKDFTRRAALGRLSAVQFHLLGLAPFMGTDVPGDLAAIPDVVKEHARALDRPVVVVVESPDERVTIAGLEVPCTLIETPYGPVGIAISEGDTATFEIAVGPDPAISIASATLTNRVTVVSRRRVLHGALDVSQNLFPRPDRPRMPYDTAPKVVEMARQLETGQQLYKSGELLKATESRDVRDLLSGKWTDPIFGCMGIYAAAASEERERHWPPRQAAHNLLRFFSALPDALIAASLVFPEDRERLLGWVLKTDATPLLRKSAGLLARFATDVAALSHPAIERYTRIPTEQPWNLQRLS